VDQDLFPEAEADQDQDLSQLAVLSSAQVLVAAAFSVHSLPQPMKEEQWLWKVSLRVSLQVSLQVSLKVHYQEHKLYLVLPQEELNFSKLPLLMTLPT